MNVVETIREKVFHLPPNAQKEVLEMVEQIEERGITDALTTDKHFEQEGFVRSLKP